jgi:predicted NBD/HSP70 family sugar kinase
MTGKVNESALLRQGEEAERQLMQIQQICMARGEAFFGMWLDGINTLCQRARAGDPGARTALRQMKEALRQAEQLTSILVPGD